MATEFFAEGSFDVAITLTPGDSGILQVIVDGRRHDIRQECRGERDTDSQPREGVEGRDPREA